MKLIRRAFFIEEAQDRAVGEAAKVLGVDKSKVVNLALAKGLAELEGMEAAQVVRELTEIRLRGFAKGSIKSVSAKRRS